MDLQEGKEKKKNPVYSISFVSFIYVIITIYYFMMTMGGNAKAEDNPELIDNNNEIEFIESISSFQQDNQNWLSIM